MERVAYANTVFATSFEFMSRATRNAALSSTAHVSSTGILSIVAIQFN
jgi:hypothetical protein